MTEQIPCRLLLSSSYDEHMTTEDEAPHDDVLRRSVAPCPTCGKKVLPEFPCPYCLQREEPKDKPRGAP